MALYFAETPTQPQGGRIGILCHDGGTPLDPVLCLKGILEKVPEEIRYAYLS